MKTFNLFRIIIHILLIITSLMGCSKKVTTSTPTSTQPHVINLSATISSESQKLSINSTEPAITYSQLPEETKSVIRTPIPTNPPLQLTFVSNHHEVYAIEIDCLDTEELCLSDTQLLFEREDWISEINWSPDGKHIAFISGEYGGNLFIADENGKNAIQITGICEVAGWPQWSPDSNKVAFIYKPTRPGCEMLDLAKIRIYNLKTGQITEILNDIYDPNRIYWLSEETFAYIGMTSETERTEMINIVQTDGTLILQLPANAKDYSHILDVTYSPDGKELSFSGILQPVTGKTTYDIYRLVVNRNELINLTNKSGNNFGPVWSPMGDWIAFESDRNSNYEIYLIKSDGMVLHQITHNPAPDTSAAWRILP